MTTLQQRAREWIAADPDPRTRAEFEDLIAAGDEAGLADRFSGPLAFGTAGIRGVLGAGPSRMNRAVVRRVTTGLAAYLRSRRPDAADRGVAVGFDARRMSRELARETAAVLLASGLRVHLARDVVPTPLLAFAVRDLDAAAGVMITASHNPPEYNGYKVYWENGAQIIPPHDAGISAAIDAVGPARDVPVADVDGSDLLSWIDEAVEARYREGLSRLRRSTDAGGLRVAYTPLHGVGARIVESVLAGAGFEVTTVPEQREPDGEFPTVSFPNPEEPGAMDMVLDLGRRIDADLVLANDPDVDRLAVAIPWGGGLQVLTGDQVGALLADYLLSSGDGPRMVATTVVSSQLLAAMARARGVAYRETLTGFKWIANAAIAYEAAGGGEFVLGYEEALGYSIGGLVRDKDGIGAALLFAELAAADRAAGRSVLDRLTEI